MTSAIDTRLRVLGAALDGARDWDSLAHRELVEAIASSLAEPTEEIAYLVHGVLNARIPEPHEVVALRRDWERNGAQRSLSSIAALAQRRARFGAPVSVVVQSGVLVDFHETNRSSYTTGIQRVARRTIAEWESENREFELVHWRDGYRFLAPIDSAERVCVIPFRCRYVLPEIMVDRHRSTRTAAILQYGATRSLAIGFDAIPVTTAETAGRGMPGAFSHYLSTLRNADVIAAISAASLAEFEGWRSMLVGTGLAGPELIEVPLPFEIGSVEPEVLERVTSELGLGDDPVVLSVGSHEPRKNHLRLLHACELLWSTGLEFTLVMVGGNSWQTEEFEALLVRLRHRGRRIVTLSGVDDEVIWALYRIARASVFCSLNEGFGLPVVESIASGTPVVTSNFGSTLELGEGAGALLVDPRDPAATADAIRLLLRDDVVHQSLVAQTRLVNVTTWSGYARQLWHLLDIDGKSSSKGSS